jgi:class 3 adenylate cyclase/predicted ATPase
MDIEAWLQGLGLERYVSAFRDNEIDWEVLPKLTSEDLRDIGVAAVGHRRKLLDAIAGLGASASAADVSTPPAETTATLAPKGDAERRQLTVMFCDLVGSTALSARLDPEDLREVIAAYHRAVADIVKSFDGFVAKYMGDGVLVYFGYPRAHEDDAERAVRAGLGLIDAVGRLDAKSGKLQARVGIATGLVVVGDLIGEGSAQEQSVVGETPNLAARLQALAESGAIVIAADTRRLVGDLFEYGDLGAVEVKGISAPVPAWQVLRPRAVASRFEALHPAELTPLVGREEEIELLLRRWQRAKSGDGQVVLLCGEPGIGKSRMATVLLEKVQSEPHSRLRYFCSAYYTESALHPTIGQLEHAACFERDDSLAAKLDKLRALLTRTTAIAEEIALLAELLSLPIDADAGVHRLTPQQKKERTFTTLVRQLGALAREAPVLMLFEDAHWADPSSCELLDRVVEHVANLPVLLVITFRPEYLPPWAGLPHVTSLTLNRLNQREGAALVERIASDEALSPATVNEIVERTDGVPLFIEELTKAVLETGANEAGKRRILSAVPGLSVAIPATLQASLLSRLDRLGAAAKQVAQIGAAIGREFPYELLAAVSQRSESDLRQSLSQLVNSGLIFARGAPPHASYLFRHALIQDTAYGALLRAPRRTLHGRIAGLLSASSGDETMPEIVARHFEAADQPAEAIEYWRKAGERAVHRAANREAIEHYRHALSLLDAQAASERRWRAELAVLSQLVPVLMAIYGWSASEVGAAVDRATEVAGRLRGSSDLAPTLGALYLFHQSRGRFDRADEVSDELFRIARELSDPEIMLLAHHTQWGSRIFLARYADAVQHASAGLALYDEERCAHHRHIYAGHDPAICALLTTATARWMLGYPDQSAHFADESVSLARKLRHAPSLAHSLTYVCDSVIMRGDIARVIAIATEILQLSDEHGFVQARAVALTFLGWALAFSTEKAEAMVRLEEGLNIWDRMGAVINLPRSLCLMAEACMRAGRYTEGLAHIDRALHVASRSREEWYTPRLYQVRAEILINVRGPGDDGVEENLRHALAVARQHDARGWELKAATTLARLWHDGGRPQQARALLSSIYNWFTEGFDTPDLKEAKALLNELT